MTDDQRVEMIEEQCEHIITLCQTYVEGDRLEDVGNIRALYEEYGEWIDTYNGMPQHQKNIPPLGVLAFLSVTVDVVDRGGSTTPILPYNKISSNKAMITEATTADWVDFWENEMPTTVEMNQDQITAMLTVSENIQEQIEIAGELWEMSDFEITALCGIVADAFADQGIKMEALV